MSGPAKLYSDYLVREGYRPSIDSDEALRAQIRRPFLRALRASA